MNVWSLRDFWAGALLGAFGIVFFVAGLSYGYGSPASMGPGFFPRILSIALILVGAGVMVNSRRTEAAGIPRFKLRPIAMVSLSTVVFAVLLKTTGLLVAAVSVVIVGAMAGERYRWWELVLLAAALSCFCALLFVYALNQPLPLWR